MPVFPYIPTIIQDNTILDYSNQKLSDADCHLIVKHLLLQLLQNPKLSILLDLSHNNITDGGLIHIAKLAPYYVRIDLTHNLLTPKGVSKLVHISNQWFNPFSPFVPQFGFRWTNNLKCEEAPLYQKILTNVFGYYWDSEDSHKQD